MSDGKPDVFNYYGVSMIPTFRAGDGLTVRPYGTSDIRPGDVVVFCPPERAHNVVHRVVRVDAAGIITRGDNCSTDDIWLLQRENIIGRVVSAQRGGRNLHVWGGRAGSAIAGILKARKWIGSGIVTLLRPLYHALACSRLLHGRLSPFREMRLLYFKRPHGTEIQLVMGKWIIGRYLPPTGAWQIRRPFRLFIDASMLPTGETSDVHGS